MRWLICVSEFGLFDGVEYVFFFVGAISRLFWYVGGYFYH